MNRKNKLIKALLLLSFLAPWMCFIFGGVLLIMHQSYMRVLIGLVIVVIGVFLMYFNVVYKDKINEEK